MYSYVYSYIAMGTRSSKSNKAHQYPKDTLTVLPIRTYVVGHYKN